MNWVSFEPNRYPKGSFINRNIDGAIDFPWDSQVDRHHHSRPIHTPHLNHPRLRPDCQQSHRLFVSAGLLAETKVAVPPLSVEQEHWEMVSCPSHEDRPGYQR